MKVGQKRVSTFAWKAGDLTDAGTFTGYGSVYGVKDEGDEVVEHGAFADSLGQWKAQSDPVPMLWSHSSREPIGGYPVDKIKEDQTGLNLVGELLKDSVQRAAETYALMKARIVKGLSIGYVVRDWSRDSKTGILYLKKLDLLEVSPCVFPMNLQAQVDAVKDWGSALPSLPEFEYHLREVCGFSKSQAAAIAGGGLAKLLRSESGDQKTEDALSRLRAATQLFKGE